MYSLGKRVADEFYIHLSVLTEVDDEAIRSGIQAALDSMPLEIDEAPNVAKYNLKTRRVALLSYPHFFEDPFPSLSSSWVFPEGATTPTSVRRYAESLNPPILHRKELLVGNGHPLYATWAKLTASAEAVGLFDDTTTIGFLLNWRRLLQRKGFNVEDNSLVPIGNDVLVEEVPDELPESNVVCRHLTALTRATLSAPVQLLQRYGFLESGQSFFDYGCGKGGDVGVLVSSGVPAAGWDPHFLPEAPIQRADVVNLGFVINVIEDSAERIEALTRAFALAKVVLCVSVMLHSTAAVGRPYRDGLLTSRRTFQKYFTQAEFRNYLEQALDREVFMVGPGIAFVFATPDGEQRFASTRYRRRAVARTLVESQGVRYRSPSVAPAVPSRPSLVELRLAENRAALSRVWSTTLDLGRVPEPDEVSDLSCIVNKFGTFSRAIRELKKHFELELLQAAARLRADDLRLALAIQQFSKRPPYGQLEKRLQRDIKAFFGSYAAARDAGIHLLREAADPARILQACKQAASAGLGYLDGIHSLQLHSSLVERLPAVLRVYVACGLRLWDSLSEVQLIKIHIQSGKLSLMEFENFDTSPLPKLKRRIKVSLRKLDYDLFEYGSTEYPAQLLYRKSRYLHEEHPGYAEQLAFDDALEGLGIPGDEKFGPSAEALQEILEARRLSIDGFRLMPSTSIPDLDAICGARLTYRSLIECGETQRRLGLENVPRNPETYNALHNLAVLLLEPVIEYYGPIRLTYGFASPALTKHIRHKIAPRLDQHASCECSAKGKLICDRKGAACDFLVEEEDMLEVAQWIIDRLPFDRLYYYGRDRPIHISYSTNPAKLAYAMTPTQNGRLVPRLMKASFNTEFRDTANSR
ncbi:DNA phosphorothioation-associated putative methyltransferase [Paraburkholderia terrae]|uniref:DNA phosphorothioation-associated putative methyltransferase n=1 Tax=Paraburkholderia terrae TaxID=311230 RepID=UPI00296AE23B|nr:DNA phosphorothioation-associated putative methyltransferase [Paraburkholderia terrae]MDW3656993.1 DNA phosphorothioation-associated putative methyltransferase [Paraburkholderia terrae]